MKKLFKYYCVIWATLFALFNVIAFVAEANLAGEDKFDGNFWIGYIFILIAFLGQLACGYFAFKAQSLQKMFYNLPLLTISRNLLIVMFVIAGITMAVSFIPEWVGILLCFIVLAVGIVSVFKASTAVEAIDSIDKKVKEQTAFIDNLTVEAGLLVNSASSDEDIKNELKKVYEAVRYSDPVGGEELKLAEAQITVKFAELGEAVKISEPVAVKVKAEELIALLKDRNARAKLMK